MKNIDKKVKEFTQRLEAGAFLRKLRNKRDISLEKLGQEFGVSHNYLGEVERGNKTPSDRLIRQLADYHNIDEAELFSKFGKVPLVAREVLKDNITVQKMIIDIEKNNKLDDDKKHKLYDEIFAFYKDIIEKYTD